VRYLRGAPDWNSQPDSRCFADDFLAGVAPMPRRRVSFAERFPTLGQWSAGDVNWERACRDVRWKAIVRPVAAPSEEFYDLRSDPHEQLNLLLQPGGLNAVQQDAWDRLRALLE